MNTPLAAERTPPNQEIWMTLVDILLQSTPFEQNVRNAERPKIAGKRRACLCIGRNGTNDRKFWA
jgi:hypothetical protein